MAVATQVVREKLYRNLHQEVPYNTQVMPVSFKELADGSWRFEQNIVVPTNHVRALGFDITFVIGQIVTVLMMQFGHLRALLANYDGFWISQNFYHIC